MAHRVMKEEDVKGDPRGVWSMEKPSKGNSLNDERMDCWGIWVVLRVEIARGGVIGGAQQNRFGEVQSLAQYPAILIRSARGFKKIMRMKVEGHTFLQIKQPHLEGHDHSSHESRKDTDEGDEEPALALIPKALELPSETTKPTKMLSSDGLLDVLVQPIH